MDNPLRWLALVLLDEPQAPDFELASQFVAEKFSEPPRIEQAGSTENMFTCTIGDYTAAATLVPNPVPWSQLEGPCETAWYWPTATEALQDHKAHWVVTLIDEGGKPVEKSLALTQLVSGLGFSSRVVGVFWGPGRLVHPSQAFIEQAVQSSADDLPLFLWIDFRVERTEGGATRLYTTGLEALGYSELEVPEFPGEPQQLLEFAYNVAHYQLSQKKHIDDGDTIGLTDEVQVVARREKSMFGDGLEVIQLDFQAALGP